MAQHARRHLGTPTFPMPISGRFMPAILLLVLGLGIMVYQNMSSGSRNVNNLLKKEGTLSNYSFKLTPEGRRNYGIWLKEWSERFVLPDHEARVFDTASFKAMVKPGQRVVAEFNSQEDPLEHDGTRRLYGLAIPGKNKTYFTGRSTIKKDNNNWVTWLMYAFLVSGTGLYVWKLIQSRYQVEEG